MITETEHIGVETHLALLHLENCTVDKNWVLILGKWHSLNYLL